jgi:hypothetical protein
MLQVKEPFSSGRKPSGGLFLLKLKILGVNN